MSQMMIESGLIAASPHAHGGNTVSRTMFLVLLALTPATLFAFWLFGWPAVHLWVITVGTALLAEVFCLRLGQRPVRRAVADNSALLTGWLLALTLPPWAPWWVGVMGSLLAVIFGKHVFGGLGQNVFNPAMVGRVALLVSFPLPLTQWVMPVPMTSATAPGFLEGLHITLGSQAVPDAVASASLLGYAKTELSRHVDLLHSLADPAAHGLSWLGARAGSLGESGAFLILAGGLFLLVMRVITWHAPVGVLLGLAVPAAIAHALDPAHFLSASVHLLSGAAMLGAFFIATDYVTSPNTGWGQLVFGLGVGFLTFTIRTWGGYPEGMAFAVLLMNALTPVIDRFMKPRILGRTWRGQPLEVK